MISLEENHSIASEKAQETKIWSSILQEVRQTDTKKLPANKSILVLGDNDTGKATLVARLAGLDAPKKGSGLEYNFIEVRDEYRDDSTKLGAWILDGDLRNVSLLNFALTEENFENSCCLLVASMDQPWNIMRSLETWAEKLENHIESLNIKAGKLKQLKQRLMLRFLNYVASQDDVDSKLIAGLNNTRRNSSRLSESEAMNDSNVDLDESVTSIKELGKDALSNNLGIDIVVVITKTDQISNLEKDYDYTEETFDFIQQAIRKFCLQYGAALFYVSAKINKNCDLLHKYLGHRIYDLPFKVSASVVERDSIFVPAGWDNEKKISILYDNIRSVDPDVDYNDFILERPHVGPTQRDTEVLVESDQEFLLRMTGDLNKQMPPAISSAPSPVQARQNLATNPIDTQPSGEGVLQNFFNSLLSKGRTMPPESHTRQVQITNKSEIMMKYTILILPLLALCATYAPTASAQRFAPGYCPSVAAHENFDKTKFFGNWIEVEKTPSIFDLMMRCLVVDYSDDQDNTVNVVVRGISLAGLPLTVNGDGLLQDVHRSGFYSIRYGFGLPIQGTLTTILDTDYEDYAVVYSCTNSILSGVFHSEYVWVLSRSGKISNPTRQNIYEKLDKLNINRSGLTMTDRSSCPTNSSTVARESENNLAGQPAPVAGSVGSASSSSAADPSASSSSSSQSSAPVLEKAGAEQAQKSNVVPLLYDLPTAASSASVGGKQKQSPPAPVDNKVNHVALSPAVSGVKPIAAAPVVKPVVAQQPASGSAPQPIVSQAAPSQQQQPAQSPQSQAIPSTNSVVAPKSSAQQPQQQSLMAKIQQKP